MHAGGCRRCRGRTEGLQLSKSCRNCSRYLKLLFTCRLTRSNNSYLCSTTFFSEGRFAYLDQGVAPENKQNKTKQKIVFTDSTKAASLRLMNNAVIIFLPKSLCFKMQTGESKLCPSVFFDFAIQCQRTQ